MIAYITELNEQNYKSFTENGLVLIDIWAKWCTPCTTISPIVDQLSSDYVNKLSVGKLDVDIEGAKDIAAELGVRNIPTIVLYNNGVVVDKLVGKDVTKENLEQLVNNHLN